MKTIKLILYFWKLNLFSAMEYRVSFIIQIFSMIINDIFFFLVWIFFFELFGTIGGLKIGEFMILLSIMIMVFGITHTFFNGYYKISEMIEEGKLDSYMLLPKNLLLRIMTSSMNISAIGDIIYAFLLMLLIPNITIFIVLQIIIYAIIGSFTFIGFMLIFCSFSFFMGSSRNIVRGAIEAILGPSHYPPGIFEGSFLKYIFITIIPVYFIVWGGFELVMNFDFFVLLKLIFGSSIFVFLGFSTFYYGLKKYESGNMININI